MSNELGIENRNNLVVLRFTRPQVRNPLSLTVLSQLEEFVDRIGKTMDVEAVIFTGSENVFASGADLREVALLSSQEAADFARKGQDLMNKICQLPQTTIAAINGFCFGGGLDLALACEWRIASPDATFAHPGAGLGIITGWGGTQRLPRLVGQTNALEMFFTAEPFDAEYALGIGLVDKVAPDIMGESLAKISETHTS